MKVKSVKSEKYRMWFNDLTGTQQMLEEHSAEGWHLISFDMTDGKFTFKKGPAKPYGYIFVVNGESYNFKVFTPDYEKIYEQGGLSLYRCGEEVPEAYETLKKRFSSPEQEKQWLEEMARQGYFLYMVEKPAYTFTMGEGEELEYIVEKALSAKDAAGYLERARKRGLEYIWGDGRNHYLIRTGETEENDGQTDGLSDPEEQEDARQKERGQRPFGGLLTVGAVGLTAAAAKLVYDVIRYSAGLTGYAPKALVDLLAAAICVGIVGFVVIKRRKNQN